MIHIGKLIQEKMKADGRSIAVIRAECGISRTLMTDIFKRESMDTAQLLTISKVLNYDFFRHYSALIPFAKSEVEPPTTSEIHAIAKEFETFVASSKKIISKTE
jgi:hypothetical protein